MPNNIQPQMQNLPGTASPKCRNHRPSVIWLTGLPGSGKSTLARALQAALPEQGISVAVLDADDLRGGLCSDLGFSPEDRRENVRRIAHVARLMMNAGLTIIVACISPYKDDRLLAREIIGIDEFIEVHVDCPLATCIERDPKGLYGKALRAEISSFTGVTAPYEAPTRADLTVNTSLCSISKSVSRCVEFLVERWS